MRGSLMSRCVRGLLLAGILLVVATPLSSAPLPRGQVSPDPVRLDRYGDPLPSGALARLGTTRLRHGSWAIMVAFAPDGKLVASAGNDNLVRLWDPVTGKQQRQLAGHRAWVNSVSFAPDGKTLASASH